MKRDFLKKLGIEDSETIEKILDENMADIGTAKGKAEAETEQLRKQIENLTQQLSDRDSQLEKLKDVDVDKLNGEIERLQAENKTAKEESDKVIAAMKLESGIKDALHRAQARDVDKVMKLLDMDAISVDKDGKIVGLDEQIKSLSADELTKSWFGNNPVLPKGTEPNPSGGTPAQKKISEMSYTELDEFMKAHPEVDISTME
jgi:hypothetical protein